MATQPNSPVIPGVTVPMPRMPPRGVSGTPVIDGPLPPGFVPQTITDSNGVSTPIWSNGTLPSGAGPSVGKPPQLHSGQASRSGPIYGNPLLNKDEDESYVSSSSYGTVVRPGGTGPTNGGPGIISPHVGVVPAGPRSGVSIYAPAPPPAVPPWGYSPGAVIPGPLPHTAPSPEEDENDDMDSETALNTRINAGIGKRGTPGQDFGRGPGSASGYSTWRR
jgi:hypothetical protein